MALRSKVSQRKHDGSCAEATNCIFKRCYDMTFYFKIIPILIFHKVAQNFFFCEISLILICFQHQDRIGWDREPKGFEFRKTELRISDSNKQWHKIWLSVIGILAQQLQNEVKFRLNMKPWEIIVCSILWNRRFVLESLKKCSEILLNGYKLYFSLC